MKSVGASILVVGLGVLATQARPVQTPQPVFHPVTSVTVSHPTTNTAVFHSATTTSVSRPTTQTAVFHPVTQTSVVHPVTDVVVTHSQTTVDVFHPQTQTEVFHPTTGDAPSVSAASDRAGKTFGTYGSSMGGKSVSSSQVTTTMSDFKPKQAKDFTANKKAAPTGGDSLALGNETNQSEKDQANKSGLLTAQSNQKLDVDPKQNKVEGLEKLVTDRAKWKQKQK